MYHKAANSSGVVSGEAQTAEERSREWPDWNIPTVLHGGSVKRKKRGLRRGAE
jgi:hypothetical protein